MKMLYNKKGFTLIEVMVAMVVLLVGMLGLMAMQYYAVNGNASSNGLRLASEMSQDMFEEVKATAYGNIIPRVDAPVPAAEPSRSGGLALQRAQWVVPNCVCVGDNGNTCNAVAPPCTQVPGPGAVNVRTVRFRTCWSDRNGVDHSVTFDTVRYDEDASI